MPKRSHGKIDAIQPLLDRAAALAGVGIVKCSEYAGLGYDRQYLYGGGLFTVEIKSSRKARLTKIELKRQKQFIRFNEPYLVICSPEELLAALGVPLATILEVLATLHGEKSPKLDLENS